VGWALVDAAGAPWAGGAAVRDVLAPELLEQLHALIAAHPFTDGKLTATGMAKGVKNNEQIDATEAPQLLDFLRRHVINNPLFRELAMPRALSHLMVSRYSAGMEYGSHTDAAIMPSGNRADVSFTLFLAAPDSYEGGELALETPFGEQRVKLAAGSMILYPTGELHRVLPVTSGERLAVVGWVQSRVRDAHRRQLLLDLEQARRAYLERWGTTAPPT